MKGKTRALALTPVVIALVFALASSAQAAPPTGGIGATLNDAIGQPCVVNGTVPGTVSDATFAVTSFGSQGGRLVANGVATVTCTAGAVSQTATQTVTAVPVSAQPGGSCQILNLAIQPIHLDVLGLVVDLDAVNLQITGQNGLLGNLLCGLAGALNNGAPTNVLANLLNRILGILGP